MVEANQVEKGTRRRGYPSLRLRLVKAASYSDLLPQWILLMQSKEQTKLDVDKKKIVLIKPIKEIGEHEVDIKLYALRF